VREVDELAAESGFSGVVRVDRDGEVFARAYGLADRRWGISNAVDTRFGLASGAKALTALAVVSLVEAGVLELSTPARAHLGADLPLIGDEVTIEHLLSHRSGIGDYFDEDVDSDPETFVLAVPVSALDTTEAYLPLLEGHPTKFAAGEDFAYCNGGYVVLALIAERASGVPFHELVVQRVCAPAGMHDTAFLRSDELPERAAVGYLSDGRTNALTLPVRGSGDGGVYSTAADIHALWAALLAGRVVSSEWVAEMLRPRSEHYGLGFWLDGERVRLEGMDAGVSFSSVHDAAAKTTYTVVSNTTYGAWPIARHLKEQLWA
jgi:CubicO group peptidase (beta-lactamase class C family)